MNSSTRGTRFYAEEFDEPIVWPRWILLPFAILAAAAFSLASMYFGAWAQRQVTVKPDVKLVATPCPKPALTQWQCDKQELAEYREACTRRRLGALINPK